LLLWTVDFLKANSGVRFEPDPRVAGKKIFDEVVRRSRLAKGDVEGALREADCKIEEMQCAFLEADGTITILKKS
jgi:hypothetical protein